MPVYLGREEVVTIKVLAEKGQANTAIAETLGVSEGTVRYHLRRAVEGAVDGRGDKDLVASSHAAVIEAWLEQPRRAGRPANLKELFEHLVEEHGYAHTYKSVVRYVRAKYPAPARRTYRRVETPPGAQTQTDWGEFPRVHLLSEGIVDLHAFVMVLSHCRKPAVIWSPRQDLLSWLSCHNEAYRRLLGVAAVNRIDNVKTAICRGAGAWGTIHPSYRAYADAVGFHVDACAPREANAKGKTEAKVRLTRLRVDPTGKHLENLEHLQSWTDERLARWSKRAICPVTGLTVEASWERELASLASLPILPEPFDIAVMRGVREDCLVNFEGRQYAVPFERAGERVEVRGCVRTVQILAGGKVIREYPRRTRELLLVDASCYEGKGTDRVQAPRPLGRMGRRLQEILELPVEQRPLDLYAALAEVSR